MNSDELSWPLLREIIRNLSGDQCDLKQVQRLSGGVINTTVLLTPSTGPAVVLKISPHRVDTRYKQEALQLELLSSLGVPTPRVLKLQIGSLESPHSFLILEHVPCVSLEEFKKEHGDASSNDLDVELAEILLKLHAHTHTHFGQQSAEHDPANKENRHEKWHECFQVAFTPILAEADLLGCISKRCRKQIGKLHEKLDQLLVISDVPRLIHGDFWSGNILVDTQGDRPKVAAIIDPTCKFWHAETELAYLELYATGSPQLRKHYQAQFKLTDSYHRIRKPIYQLYFLINQIQLHGPTNHTLEKLSNLSESISRFA